MKATIEIDINVDNKYGHTTLSFGPGKSITSDMWNDEFDNIESIEYALEEIATDYIKEILKKLEEEDD